MASIPGWAGFSRWRLGCKSAGALPYGGRCSHSAPGIYWRAVAVLVGTVMPIHYLRWPVAGILLVLGVSRLIRHRHPRWVGMRVGMGGLTLWSFLMASAHGAGLMVVPVFLRMAMEGNRPACHALAASAPTTAIVASVLHAVGYLLVTAVVAVLVFEKLGLRLLRKAWFNLDLVWAATLIATGLITALL